MLALNQSKKWRRGFEARLNYENRKREEIANILKKKLLFFRSDMALLGESC